MKTKYSVWTLIDWDGNHALGFKCWRKSFGRGHVSVGVGEFRSVVYSYGPDSDDSISSIRGVLTEQEAMTLVDSTRGRYVRI